MFNNPPSLEYNIPFSFVLDSYLFLLQGALPGGAMEELECKGVWEGSWCRGELSAHKVQREDTD